MSKNLRFILGISLALVGALAFLFYSLSIPSKEITRAQLQELLKNNSIVAAKVSPTPYTGIYAVEGTEKSGQQVAKFKITTHLDEVETKTLVDLNSVKVEIPGKGVTALLVNLLPPLIIGGVVIGLLVYQTNIGKSKKGHRVKHRPETRFRDVAGIEEAKSEVQEIVDFLKNPKKYKRLGGLLPKGVLLIGPPGTGKTMLAKAIAGEAEANFFSAHGSDFNEIFVGVGAKRIRELFKQAAKNKPAIIFIDEIDCLAKKRKMDGHGELQNTNNALLAAMDGFEPSDGIVVLGATNRPEDLDEALVRPGRFDRKVHVPLPDRKGRRAILASHTLKKPIQSKEATLDLIAQTTPDLSGADLASIINEAAILCAQKNLEEIGLAELEESRDKVRWGKERKSMVLKKEEREMVAYHEAGHTIINLQKALLPPLYKVSIIPRGAALGVTTLLPIEDQNIHSKTFLLEQMVVLMGGRAAEKVFYGATTNGAHGDLDTAKKIAHKMIHDWGMGEKLYYQSEQKDAEVEINRLLETADKEALAIVQREKDNTHKLAHALLQHDTLTREQVLELLQEGKLPSPESKPVLN
ncbi:MAG: AAA family ATPase [Verrucomicrobiota bacterium]